MLYYSAGRFVQFLEGGTGKIHTLFETVAADKRYENVKPLTLRPVERRIFAHGYGKPNESEMYGRFCILLSAA